MNMTSFLLQIILLSPTLLISGPSTMMAEALSLINKLISAPQRPAKTFDNALQAFQLVCAKRSSAKSQPLPLRVTFDRCNLRLARQALYHVIAPYLGVVERTAKLPACPSPVCSVVLLRSVAFLILVQGPTIGSAKAPLIQSAGENIVFSKKLIGGISEWSYLHHRL